MTLQETPLLSNWPDKLVLVGVTLVLALVLQLVVNVAIRQAVAAATRRADRHRDARPGRTQAVLAEAGLSQERAVQRAATMGSILRSVASFAIILVTVLTIMGAVGLPLAPLLASAGVGGLAIGFGAQSLVKDFLAGIFMIVEDQYGVGDLVDLGVVTGTVEDVTLRVTRVRDAAGQVWYVRNGEIARVGNVSQGWSTAMVDVPVPFTGDTEGALRVLRRVCEDLAEDPAWRDVLLEAPAVLGVEAVAGGAVTLRMRLKTAANQQWAVSRELRERALVALGAAGLTGGAPAAEPTPSG